MQRDYSGAAAWVCAGPFYSNLLVYQDHLLNAFENKFQVDSVYTDFSKAFDRVDHKLLLAKLKAYGMGEGALKWLCSFLSGRTQYVRINNHISNAISALSGVPQGSHLGPLLFLLFVNDIYLFIKNSHFLMFADDLKLYSKITSLQDCEKLQADVNALFEWSLLNRLNLNIGKCC